MDYEKQQVYGPAMRGMILARIHQLTKIALEMESSADRGTGDAADIASRLIEVSIALRLLVLSPEPPLADF